MRDTASIYSSISRVKLDSLALAAEIAVREAESDVGHNPLHTEALRMIAAMLRAATLKHIGRSGPYVVCPLSENRKRRQKI